MIKHHNNETSQIGTEDSYFKKVNKTYQDFNEPFLVTQIMKLWTSLYIVTKESHYF